MHGGGMAGAQRVARGGHGRDGGWTAGDNSGCTMAGGTTGAGWWVQGECRTGGMGGAQWVSVEPWHGTHALITVVSQVTPAHAVSTEMYMPRVAGWIIQVSHHRHAQTASLCFFLQPTSLSQIMILSSLKHETYLNGTFTLWHTLWDFYNHEGFFHITQDQVYVTIICLTSVQVSSPSCLGAPVTHMEDAHELTV